jgi:collagen triple helix repeat protein
MLGRLHDRLGTAGMIVAVIALVAALTGSALAASGALTGQQKKEVKKIAKKFAGKDGAQGPAGQTGAQGPKGDAGAGGADGQNGQNGLDGENGKDGKNGESVIMTSLPKGDANCPEGGTKFTVGEEESFACNGIGGTGPSGEIMTGAWEVQGENGYVTFGSSMTTINFHLPLEAAPTSVVIISGASVEAEIEKCGTGEAPKPVSGVLCLYPIVENETLSVLFPILNKEWAVLGFSPTNQAVGNWAVKTAP